MLPPKLPGLAYFMLIGFEGKRAHVVKETNSFKIDTRYKKI